MVYSRRPFDMKFQPSQRLTALALLLGWLSVLAVMPAAWAIDYMRVELADGFDFPVGKPDAVGYYKARGFTPNGHLGEDWNGRGGGDSDLGDPIYTCANGVVVVSENIGGGWGNCIIVRHAYRDSTGRLAMVDSQYGHLLKRQANVGDIVKRGQQIGTMGGNSGMYPVHLHFEMRKNLQIGMNRTQFGRDYSNYYSPTHFINSYRTCSGALARVEVPINNFAAYGKTLATVDTKPYLKRGYSIPVYRAPSATLRETQGSQPVVSSLPPRQSSLPPVPTQPVSPPTTSSGRKPVVVSKVRPSQQPQVPPPTQKTDTGSFWSRLRAKFKNKKNQEGLPPASGARN
jgi:hypothetical protein